MGNINSGFNNQQIKTQMEAIQASYDKVAKALSDDFKGGLVDKVAEYWACQEAVDFWKSFAETVEKLIETAIFGTYDNLFKTINSCAHAWAETTGKGSVWSENEVKLKKYNAKLNTSSIKENIGNDRGINGKQVQTIADAAFTEALNSTKTAIQAAADAIDSTGFIDEQKAQMNAVKNGLNSLLTAINDAISKLKEQLSTSVEQCVTKYGDTAGSVAGAYGA